ncbi:unnamed protein product (macronuclear) [Paramecium tetraurelia]|uniref:UvrD-like helicase ATP-binding domain-containing protein n=1 Tax=Paramecium tetraurelia TaxID=5888 RepID=A0BL67_PARTE|nr:uncharacterized protein GSPATT00029916001 [Paramecium tetraurelia]CAK59284.1 unnamed protein product [Paramecium tetraurelia]|eukprot:XP_001426682.1 hypothetical protein (macronuclear) [Paramecium tetraurelia strain d4-2]
MNQEEIFQKEEERFVNLGKQFCPEQPTNFKSGFIPKFLEFYVKSQMRDKCAQLIPVNSLTNSPLRYIFNNFDINLLFPQRKWEFTMTETFLEQFKFETNVLFTMHSILQGNFKKQPSKINLSQQTLPNVEFYLIFDCKNNRKDSVIVQIIPKQKFTLNSQNQLQTLEYVQQMVFICLGKYDYDKPLRKYEIHQEEDPFLLEELSLIQEIKKPKMQSQSKEQDSFTFQDFNNPKSYRIPNFQADKYVFNQNYQRWVKKQNYNDYKKRKQTQNDLKGSYFQLKKYLFTPNFQQYRNLLKNIKSENFTTNMEQFEAIAKQGDTILIGRSGTGKTTISLLKLFITDAIFMLRQNLDLVQESNSKINLQYTDQLSTGIQLKTLFLTSSPLLAQQIKQKYDNLVKNVQQTLREKNKVQKFSEQLKENLDESTVQILDVLEEEEENASQFQIEDEEENEEDIDQYEKEMGQFQTLSDIKQFPAFLTIRKLLFLIDSQLNNPFFKNKEQIHRSAQWHNEYFGVLSLNQSVTNNNFQEQLNSEVNDLDSKEVIYHNNNLKEVTLECFKDFFWPKIIQDIGTADRQYFTKLDPTLIWSDIINIIKGQENSFKNPNFHLIREDYQNYYLRLRCDQDGNRQKVFNAFLIYEKLKSKYGYYDILDLINHINFQQVYCHDNIEYMHYIILDELQDVPKALLILLNRMTQVQLFLAGDNAQNIVKGVGIKFQDIVNCLEKEISLKSSINLPQTSLIQLSYNFRSTNQILQLGNTIVNALELFFPKYLDFLQKEKSNKQGPKPIVIQSIQTQDLLNYLFKEYQNKQSNVEFGSNSVIIVKDQESKLKIPIELQNLIILTIYEAKGLEFDDVILFNFFADACVDENAWSLFQTLEIVKIRKDQRQWNSAKQLQTVLMQKNISKNEVELTKLELRQYNQKNSKQNKNLFNSKNVNLTLQHELKQLYVAVTRPKQRLIIFDQSQQNRYYIQQIWEELELVQIVHEQQIQEFKFKLSFQIDNKTNWKKQGYRMLRQNNYEQAQKCFMFANENELAKKSLAYNLATQATLNSNNSVLFIEAAQIFEEINLPKRAASCYFSGKNYEKAFKIYQSIGCKDEMAESAYFSGQYQIAGQIFSELGEVRRSIECFNKEQLWDVSLDQLNGNQLTSQEKLMFLNIIVPKYLKKITEDIEKEEMLEQQKEQINNPHDETDSFEVDASLLNQSQMTQKDEINVLEDSQSFQVVKDDSLDHLSIFDPDDEWIKPENKSLIKSIASSSIESQFSNVLLMNQPSITPLLKSRLNIFMKNNVMLKLAERFQQFKDEFKILLENQKSQCALLSFRNQDEKELDHMINFLYELENFDIEAVYFVLDVLEQFKSYKLCIYVCNQFKLSSHLGRYLVSLASQYTPMTKNNFKLENWIVGNNLKRKRLLDQAMLAQMAFNNILESINPIYLKFKYEEQLHSFNSFGLECYKSLIGLGYWRTIIHQLNYENAVQLCQSFNNYQDLVILIEKVKDERQNKQLTDEEKHQLIRYNYFIQVEQYFISNQSNKIDIDQSFEITIQCSSKRILTKDNIVQLVKNSKLRVENLTYEEKLKQLESIILCMLCSMGVIKFEIDQQCSLIIDLIEQQQYCLNQLAFVNKNQNINEALQFLFKFSFPTGGLMMDFSQYCIIHITSKLLKNVNEQMIFIDIAYEYIAIPFEALGKIIKTYLCNLKPVVTLTQALDNQQGQQETKHILKFLKQRLQYQYENILLRLTFPINDQIDYYSKIAYGSRQKSIANSIDDHKTSILNFIKSDEMRTAHKWLLQQNCRINKMNKQLKYYLNNESIILFEQGLKNQDQKHGYIILALNLLHLQDNLPFAIFTIQNLKNKQDQQYYLKYLEFLECQNFDIIEDSFECFLEYSQYFEQKMYLDEWMNHLTRIGIKLLLAQQGISKVLIPQKYQDIISYQQHIDQPLFKISRPEIVLEFIEQLLYYIEACNSEHYEHLCNLLLIVFMVNLQNLHDQIKERLMEIFSNNTIYQYYKRLHQCLNQKNPNLQQELIDKMNVLIIKGYFEEQLITIQIKQSTHNLNSQKVYQDCLNKWEGYFVEAQQIEKNGINLLKKWRQFKSNHQNNMNVFKNKLSPFVIRFYQFHKLQLRDMQSQKKAIEHQSHIVKIYNFQEELLKLRQKMLRGADLQFVNLILNNSTNLLKEIMNGNLQADHFEELKQKYYNWKCSFSTLEKNEQELLERNRQILKLKWQKLQAGVKVQNMFDSHCIKTVEEHIDEESQD